MKMCYLLAGATMCSVDSAPLWLKVPTNLTEDIDTGFILEPCFAVQEHDFAVLHPCKIIFGSAASAEEVQQCMVAIVDGPHSLSWSCWHSCMSFVRLTLGGLTPST